MTLYDADQSTLGLKCAMDPKATLGFASRREKKGSGFIYRAFSASSHLQQVMLRGERKQGSGFIIEPFLQVLTFKR
jgi:hypothetical protein